MTFARMLKESAATLNRIYTHSYNQELHSGFLERQTFKSYLEQDALYLVELGKTLSLIQSKLKDEKHRALMQKLAEETIHYEKTMLSDYLGDPLPLFAPAPKLTPVIKGYTEHLLNAAKQSSVEVAISSVLPCFWIYSELGRQMSVGIAAHHPYHKWILSYANDEFMATTLALREVTETLAASSNEQNLMVSAFVTSAQFELAFYQQTYPHQEPVLQKTLTQTI